MNHTISGKEILGGYALAAVTLCFGFYVATAYWGVGPAPALVADAGTFALRVFSLLAAAIVLNFTLAWGRLRGFGVGKPDGTISLTNLARNIVAAAIVFGGLCFISAPMLGVFATAAR